MRNSVKTNRMKSLFSAVKKPFACISRKTEPARQFMAQGRAGAMILETAIGVQFFGTLVYDLFTGNVPAVLCFLIAAALFGSYQYKHQLQTVRLIPSMFDAADFDFTQVVQMEIVTDGAEAGELAIDDISVRMK